MFVTIEKLNEMGACAGGKAWFDVAYPAGVEAKELCERLLKEEHFDWANWFVSRALTQEKKVEYAIFAAELVLHVFEEKYPEDNRPRKAIETAKKYLKDKTDAADAAYAAAYAADAAAYAADAAAYAAAYAADAAAYAADAAAYAADAAADAAEFKIKIIAYGVSLLGVGE